MQDKANGGRPKRSNRAQDITDQGIVLMHVLDLHPVNLIVPQLVSGLTADTEAFADGDRYERAVRDLVSVGLLRIHRGLIVPTRPALRFSEIMEGDGVA
jgi:hypothetical protein